MVRTTENIVDIVRSSGPGALPLTGLTEELRRRRPAMKLDEIKMRRLVERAGDRLLLLEVAPDAPAGVQAMEPLDSWVVLTSAADAPSRCRLTHLLWCSLAALAEEVDPDSRVSVSRWVLLAGRARRICERLAGREEFPEPGLRLTGEARW